MCQAAQPLAAIAASRYALGADGVVAARPGTCGSLVAAFRAASSAPMAWALRRCAPGRLHVPPPITRALPLSGGHVVVEDVVRFALIETLGASFALLPRARVGGGGFRSHHARGYGGNACVLPQHVQCESARRASATEAPYALTPRPGRPPAL